jgi:hypothetical protein
MTMQPVLAQLPAQQMDELRLSPKQAELFELLLKQYVHDPYALMPGYAINRRLLTGNSVGLLRAKLQRVGWDVVGQMGRHGGYRLGKLTQSKEVA